MNRLPQIDSMKAAAALSVVLLHTLRFEMLVRSWSVLWIWQAVPVFIILMGITARLSLDRRRDGSTQASALKGMLQRLGRLVVPLAPVWLASLLLAFARGEPVYVGPKTLLFNLPGPGRGTWFVAIAVALTLVAPLIYRAVLRWPAATILGSFVLAVGFELVAPHSRLLSDSWNYAVSPLRYLPLFVLGMWLGRDLSRSAMRRQSILVLPFAALSAIYLALWNLGFVTTTLFVPDWLSQSPASFGYPLLLVTLGLLLLPEKTPSTVVPVAVAELGAASYHIFMVQVIVTVIAPTVGFVRAALNVVACALIGVVWFRLERPARRGGRHSGTDRAGAARG